MKIKYYSDIFVLFLLLYRYLQSGFFKYFFEPLKKAKGIYQKFLNILKIYF